MMLALALVLRPAASLLPEGAITAELTFDFGDNVNITSFEANFINDLSGLLNVTADCIWNVSASDTASVVSFTVTPGSGGTVLSPERLITVLDPPVVLAGQEATKASIFGAPYWRTEVKVGPGDVWSPRASFMCPTDCGTIAHDYEVSSGCYKLGHNGDNHPELGDHECKSPPPSTILVCPKVSDPPAHCKYTMCDTSQHGLISE